MSPDDPIVRGAKTVRALSGLSGAHVFLMTKDDRTWFVRKVARDPANSARLRRQIAKQRAFGEALGDVVRTPRILSQGDSDGRFYVDMEFVRGADGITYLRRCNYSEVVAFADRFCAYIEAVAAKPPEHPAETTLFEALYTKLCEVQRKTSSIGSETLVRLFMALERLRGLDDDLRPTLCHGDLTLENLVVDDQGRICMIDLLDAPFEHYWQDVAKLHQDLEGGWYLLQHSSVARCVTEYFSRRLLASAIALDERYAEVHAVLLACTFVRILPYVRSDAEQQFVQQRIQHFAGVASMRGIS